MRRPRPRPKSKPVPIGPLVDRVLDDLGLDAATHLLRIVECWEEAVGETIAAHCEPSALRGSVLEARVDSSVWCQELQLRKPEILAALRRRLGDEAPTEIFLLVS